MAQRLHDALLGEAQVFRAHDGRINHVKPQRVRAIGIHDVPGVGIVFEALGHLAPVLGQHEAIDDHILVRRLVEQRGAKEHQRVKPAAGLVETFGDEVRREKLGEFFGALKRIMLLGVRHGA